MTFEIRVDFGPLLAVFCALFIFGLFYNQLIAWLERNHYLEGFTSLAVAFGSFITLLGASILSWQAGLLVLICFIASGLPMIIGSIIRYVRIRAREIEAIKHDIQTARMAK